MGTRSVLERIPDRFFAREVELLRTFLANWRHPIATFDPLANFLLEYLRKEPRTHFAVSVKSTVNFHN